MSSLSWEQTHEQLDIMNSTLAFFKALFVSSDELISQNDILSRNSNLLTILILLMQAALPLLLLWLIMVLWNFYHNNLIDNSIKQPLPPGSVGFPFIGETLSLMRKDRRFLAEKKILHGNIFKSHLFGIPVIAVIGGDNIKKVLMAEHQLVEGYWPTSFRKLLGQGSIASASGDLHTLRRRALQKAFTYDALVGYVSVIQKIIKDIVADWCQQDSVKSYEECKRLSLAVAAEALVGFDMSSEEQKSLVHTFEDLADNLFCLPIELPGTALTKGMKARDAVLEGIGKCLKKTGDNKISGIELPVNDEKDKPIVKDAMTRLREVRGDEELTLFEVKDLCLELLLAGHASSASALCSLLIHLNERKDVIAKIWSELEEYDLVDGDVGDLSYSLLNKMEYVSAVVGEILRLLPPIGGGFRKVLKTFTLNGYQIPVGWTVLYSIPNTQRDDTIFHDHESFNPDRWLNNEELKKIPSYIPFGNGPRACVGKEFAKIFLKACVIELVRSCSWERLDDSSEVRIKDIPFPHPLDGFPVRFKALPRT